MIRPGSRYAMVKVTNGTMTAHKGVWSWTAQAKEEYMTVEGTSDEIGASLNKYAQQGWKVRAATTEYFVPRNDAHIFVILYREAQ